LVQVPEDDVELASSGSVSFGNINRFQRILQNIIDKSYTVLPTQDEWIHGRRRRKEGRLLSQCSDCSRDQARHKDGRDTNRRWQLGKCQTIKLICELHCCKHYSATSITYVTSTQAVASVSYRTNDIAYIFPITPASPMGEIVDEWASTDDDHGNKKFLNLWGQELKVVEMQSEAGAAGALHGALNSGSLATTYTSSQVRV
jgi:hypothetical protein